MHAGRSLEPPETVHKISRLWFGIAIKLSVPYDGLAMLRPPKARLPLITLERLVVEIEYAAPIGAVAAVLERRFRRQLPGPPFPGFRALQRARGGSWRATGCSGKRRLNSTSNRSASVCRPSRRSRSIVLSQESGAAFSSSFNRDWS